MAEAGRSASKFKVSGLAGVGCLVDSCGTCPACPEKEESHRKGPVSWTATHNGCMKPQNKDFNCCAFTSTIEKWWCLEAV